MNAAHLSSRFAIDDATQIGEVRRRLAVLSEEAGFDATEAGKAALVVNEAAGNIIKHAGRGEIVVRFLGPDYSGGIELLAIDRGPGIADVSRAMEDGYSTAGSPGTGLGAMSRLATYFDVYSQPGKGTVVLAQMTMKPSASRFADLEIGVVCLPYPGEHECGDGWAVRATQGHYGILVVDGLGHGAPAKAAAEKARQLFCRHTGGAAEYVAAAHAELHSTRGAALAIVEFDAEAKSLRYCGVGNIAATIVGDDKPRGLMSHNGTVGHQMHKHQEIDYAYAESDLLILHSDGLHQNWNLGSYPGLRHRHPAMVTAILYRDFRRARDDATVLVLSRKAFA